MKLFLRIDLEYEGVHVVVEILLQQLDVFREKRADAAQLGQYQHYLAEVRNRHLRRLLHELQRLKRLGGKNLDFFHLLPRLQVLAVGREEDEREEEADLGDFYLDLAHPAVHVFVRPYELLRGAGSDEVRRVVLELAADVAVAADGEGEVAPHHQHLQAPSPQQHHLVVQPELLELGNPLAELDELPDAGAHDVAEVLQHADRSLVLQHVERQTLGVQQVVDVVHLLRVGHIVRLLGRFGFSLSFRLARGSGLLETIEVLLYV